MEVDAAVGRGAEERSRDARANEAARREVLRADGARDLGANLERAAALIAAAFELRDAVSGSRR